MLIRFFQRSESLDLHSTDVHISWESHTPVTSDVAGGQWGLNAFLFCSLTITTLPAMSMSESQQGIVPRLNIPPEIWLEIMRSASDVPDSLEYPQLRHINEGTCLSGLAIERYQNSMVSHIQLHSDLI